MMKVFEVEIETTEHLFHRVGIAIVKRGVRSHSWTYLIQQFILWIVYHYLVDIELALRTRTYKRHVTYQDIPQLGKFVKMMLTKEFA